MFDRWQNFLKIFFSEKCSDLSQFLRVESISEVCFAKNQFQEKFQEMDFLVDFLEFLKICMEKQMQIIWNSSEMYTRYIR